MSARKSSFPRRSPFRLDHAARRAPGRAFTLIEVLVVVSIIALLISILMPSLNQVREQAKASVCLSNLKQIGTGLTLYLVESKGLYPMHSSLKSQTTDLGKPRTRWPDYLHRYMRNEEVYSCTNLTKVQQQDFSKPWAHNPNRYYGGYGYNFQYLGNARYFPGNQSGSIPREWTRPFHAVSERIRQPAMTAAVADVRGSKMGNPDNRFGQGAAAVYSLDPPLGSRDMGSKGSRKNSADPDTDNRWYEGGTDLDEQELVRSAPDPRHLNRTTVTFCDGHAERMDVDVLDAKDKSEAGDNRYYNGRHDPTAR